MKKPYWKPYPREIKDRLNHLLPRFYRLASERLDNRHYAFSYLWYIAAVSEGIYLVLPDAYGVLDHLKKYVDGEIRIFQLWDEVKYILRYNEIEAVMESYQNPSVNVELPRRIMPLLKGTVEGFVWDYPSQDVKQTFRTHTGILQLMVMTIADFGVPGRLLSALFFYVNGKTTSEQLLNEIDDINLTFRGLKKGLRF
jgi:hypothetical protein